MRLTFIGAAHEVTGSCHCLEAAGKKILVDYGMEQGLNLYENAELPFPVPDIDYVLLTHAHVDHSGMLPLLYKHGFRGKIYTTEASTDLCRIMLRDSAHIQEFEAEWRNRKAKRSGGELFEPMYTLQDADAVMKHFVPCAYREMIDLGEGIQIRFTDIGHLLGSASIEVWVNEDEVSRKLVFSGDIGNINQPIIKNPEYTEAADIVIMESTYGNRNHGERPDYIGQLSRIIQETFDRGGNVIIPCFAVGRTQEMLYFLRKIKEENRIARFPDFPVYVDSPLAVEATSVFQKNIYSCFDEEAMELVSRGVNPLQFPGLRLSVTSNESRAINFETTPKVILSASGMCEAGRIRHHLKHNLWRQECTVLFVGYQANGTLGRTLLEGAGSVKLFGEVIEVRATIEKLAGISGHADKDGLIRWLQAFKEKPGQVYIVHGEDSVCDEFAEVLQKNYGYQARAPYSGDVYDIETGELCREGKRIRMISKEKAIAKRNSQVYARLVAAGQRLLHIIRDSSEMANKDIAKFADQITALCDKWER